MPTNAELVEAGAPTSTATTTRIDLSPLARAGIGVVAFAAAVLSFSALRQLAISCQTWDWLAPLFPVSIDAAAAFGTLVWLRAERTEVAKLARRLTFTAIVLSVVGNGTRHGLEAANISPPWWVAVLVGAVAPGVFGAVIHLAVTATGRVRSEPVTKVEPVVETVPEVVPDVDPEPEPDVPDGPPYGPPTLEDAILAAHTRPKRPSERDLAAELDITRHQLRVLERKLGIQRNLELSVVAA